MVNHSSHPMVDQPGSESKWSIVNHGANNSIFSTRSLMSLVLKNVFVFVFYNCVRVIKNAGVINKQLHVHALDIMHNQIPEPISVVSQYIPTRG